MEEDTAFVSLRLKALTSSERLAIPLAKISVGGPQFVGSWLLPVIPASPEILVRFAKKGTTFVRNRLNLYPVVRKSSWLNRCAQLAFMLMPSVSVVSTNAKRLDPLDRIL